MLTVENLTVVYPSQPRPALQLDHLILESSAVILGPSGAGKSTFLKALLGLVPTRGSMYLEGVGIARRPLTARRLLAYMPQENALPGALTLGEYLSHLARLDGIPAHRVGRAVQDILALVNLSSQIQQRLQWLSGGMKRRALLAGTLLRQSPWLLLDEPTLGLDPAEQAAIRSLIRNLSRHRRVILTTQVVEDAGAIPDRIVVLRRGVVLTATDWDQLRQAARGRLFRVPFSDEVMASSRVWEPESGGAWVRVLGAELASQSSAQPLEPTAEDGYLWILEQSDREEAP